jgi:flagellum-specific ATP synthase
MARKEKIREFLTQGTSEQYDYNQIVSMFKKVLQ